MGAARGRGGRAHSPSFPGSLEASTHRFHDCPSIASGLGRGRRSPTVAIAAAAEVEAAPGPPSSGRRRRAGMEIFSSVHILEITLIKLQIYKSENTMKCFTNISIRQLENDFTLGQKVKKR